MGALARGAVNGIYHELKRAEFIKHSDWRGPRPFDLLFTVDTLG
jgi:hypothetical protein